MANNTLSVIIPHFNDFSGLEITLQALEYQTRQPDEIIIVDNGSHGGLQTVQAVIEKCNLRPHVISENERGAGPARNAGVQIASGSILAFLDCDCRPNVNWVEEAFITSAQHPIVGGEVQIISENGMNAYEAWDILFGFDAEKFLRCGGHLLTSGLIVRKVVFTEVGPFKKDLPEDTEWCHRAVAKGFPLVFDRNLIVSHRALPNWPLLKSRWLRITREAFLYWQSNRRGRITWCLRAFLVLGSIIPHSVKVILAPAVPGFSRKWHVIWVLVRVRTLRFSAGCRLLFS